MKKFIVTFFSMLLFSLTSVSGGLLLSACDRSSYSENTGGGGFVESTSNVLDFNNLQIILDKSKLVFLY